MEPLHVSTGNPNLFSYSGGCGLVCNFAIFDATDSLDNELEQAREERSRKDSSGGHLEVHHERRL